MADIEPGMTLDEALALTSQEPRISIGTATPRRCRRHSWHMVEGIERCRGCAQQKDAKASRRGRTNRARGNQIERDVCRRLGIARRGHYGGPDDGGDAGDWITVQVKSGGAFSERLWGLLAALPERADQLRAVVVTDAPGPGHRRRAMVILDLEQFADWYATPRDQGA